MPLVKRAANVKFKGKICNCQLHGTFQNQSQIVRLPYTNNYHILMMKLGIYRNHCGMINATYISREICLFHSILNSQPIEMQLNTFLVSLIRFWQHFVSLTLFDQRQLPLTLKSEFVCNKRTYLFLNVNQKNRYSMAIIEDITQKR